MSSTDRVRVGMSTPHIRAAAGGTRVGLTHHPLTPLLVELPPVNPRHHHHSDEDQHNRNRLHRPPDRPPGFRRGRHGHHGRLSHHTRLGLRRPICPPDVEDVPPEEGDTRVSPSGAGLPTRPPLHTWHAALKFSGSYQLPPCRQLTMWSTWPARPRHFGPRIWHSYWSLSSTINRTFRQYAPYTGSAINRNLSPVCKSTVRGPAVGMSSRSAGAPSQPMEGRHWRSRSSSCCGQAMRADAARLWRWSSRVVRRSASSSRWCRANREPFLAVYTRATVCTVAGADASVSVREFRAHLADHLARAAAGEPVTVSRHGRPDVVVGPLPSASKEDKTK